MHSWLTLDLKEGEELTLLTQIEDLSLKAKNRSEHVPSIKSPFLFKL